MVYQIDEALENFAAWSGGKDTLDFLIKTGDVDQIDELIEQGIGGETNIPTATDINDFLWFERDQIASYLGYYDWDSYEHYWNWEEGDEVFWYDPEIDEYENPDEAMKRVWIIEDIDKEGETAWIYEKDLGGPAGTEVPLSELELVRAKD